MLDLFKNIISRKIRDKEGSELTSSDSSSINETNNEITSISNSTSNGEQNKSSIKVLLEIHPELAEYYSELHERYLLSDKIGDGAFSVVYKAYDSKENRYLAIKIINKLSMKPDQIASILKEIAIMRQLNHPNIVKLYNYQNSNDSKYCFLFLEYIAGGEIFNQIIKYTYFSENLSRHILRQVAFSVKYLHDNGIVHRDIKPENLLFEPSTLIPRSNDEQLLARRKSDDDNKVDEGKFTINNGSGGIGIVKLADFGLSTQLQNSLARTPCGTVGYTSPEQHMNVGYDKKVDMWALGCVLYTMVVGFPPFYSNTQDTNDINEKVINGKYQFLKPWFDEVSNECKCLISNLLTVDPQKRYSIEQLLSDPWLNIGYEDDNTIQKMMKSSNPADDIPKTTFDDGLFKTFSEDLINTDNVGDYFSGHNITCDDGTLLTPRAEAIKLVFDTAGSMMISPNDNNNNNNNRVIDIVKLEKPTKVLSSTDSISDLDSDASIEFNAPENIVTGNLEDDDDDDDDDEEDGEDEEDDDDDLSLDSEDDTDDYPITLTTLSKTKSPMIRRHLVESSTSSCLSPVHSHATTATLTTQSTQKSPSLKSFKSTKSIKSFKSIDEKPTKKIAFIVSDNDSKRSGSISSDLSNLSLSSGMSTNSGIIRYDYSNAVHDYNYDNNDTNNTTINDYDNHGDKTPIVSESSIKHKEFRSRCQTHTPYVFKGENEDVEIDLNKLANLNMNPSESLEDKLQQHSVVQLQLNSATILSRRNKQRGNEVA